MLHVHALASKRLAVTSGLQQELTKVFFPVIAGVESRKEGREGRTVGTGRRWQRQVCGNKGRIETRDGLDSGAPSPDRRE